MDHPVTIKRVIAAQWLVQLVFGVAQIDSVKVGRNAPRNKPKVRRGHFLMLGGPCTVEIGVIAGLER